MGKTPADVLDLADSVVAGSAGLEIVGALMAPEAAWREARAQMERDGIVSTGDTRRDRLYSRMRSERKLTMDMIREMHER